VVLPARDNGHVETDARCGTYIVNAGQSGFFRVRYDQANLARLTSGLRTLDTTDQMGLLLDYYTFGRSGDAPFTDYLELVNALGADADPIVALDTATSLLAISGYAAGRPSETAVQNYARGKLRPFFARLGWEPRAGEASNDALARAQLIGALGALGDAEITAEARRRVLAAQSDPTALAGSVRTAALGVFAFNADAADYEILLARAGAAGDFVEQRRMWLLLASTKDATLARRTLDLALDETIPRQLRPQVIANVADAHPRLTWEFVLANRAAIEALLDPLQRMEYLAGIASASSDPAIAAELETLARDFPEGARPSIASAGASIRLRAQTIAERMPAVEAWIAARNAPAPRRRR